MKDQWSQVRLSDSVRLCRFFFWDTIEGYEQDLTSVFFFARFYLFDPHHIREEQEVQRYVTWAELDSQTVTQSVHLIFGIFLKFYLRCHNRETKHVLLCLDVQKQSSLFVSHVGLITALDCELFSSL